MQPLVNSSNAGDPARGLEFPAIGHPGMVHNNQRKMAAKTHGHPEGHHDTQRTSHSGTAPTSFRKKSKRKTERDNKRAAEFQQKKAEKTEREVSAATAKPSKEDEARKTKEEVAPTAKDAPDDDENTANENTSNKDTANEDTANEDNANENIAQTSNGARVSVINADKTLGDSIKSMSYSFHDTPDTDSKDLLNVDGNESLENLDDLTQSRLDQWQTADREPTCTTRGCGGLFSVYKHGCPPCRERSSERLEKLSREQRD